MLEFVEEEQSVLKNTECRKVMTKNTTKDKYSTKKKDKRRPILRSCNELPGEPNTLYHFISH